MVAALARLSCTFFLLFVPLALAQQQDFARLLAYPETGSTGVCTPLILIHGIHGTGVDPGCEIDALPRAADGKPADCNWWPLIDYLKKNDTATWHKTQIYIYRYISDKGYDAWTIGHELRNQIDKQKIPPNLLIVAHSMGGIVARNFMNYTLRGSSVRVYVMTLALVTLATPHHGSPLANLQWLNWTAEKLTYWTGDCYDLVCVTPNGRFTSLDDLFWRTANKSPAQAIHADLPNRSDLVWDDYDGLFQAARDEFKDKPGEENPILSANRSTTDARKAE